MSETGPESVASDAAMTALVKEAGTKSGLLWVRPAPGRAWPAWHVWLDGAAYVVSGPGEQELPPLAGPVDLVLRSKDTGARLLTLRATATTVTPDDPDWEPVTTALKADRLNAPDPEHLVERWAGSNTVTRLAPTGGVVEAPEAYDASSGAAAPPPTPATTSGWAPWHLRGRRTTRRQARQAARRAGDQHRDLTLTRTAERSPSPAQPGAWIRPVATGTTSPPTQAAGHPADPAPRARRAGSTGDRSRLPAARRTHSGRPRPAVRS